MKKFQAIIKFTMDDQFMTLVPPHRSYINFLFNKSIIDSYAVSMESQTCWITLNTDSKEAAAKYASRIEQINMFDVCLLGMGNDGHIASLTPNHPALNSSQLCCEMTDSPNLPKERITLTLKTFSRTQNRILVTTGPSKVAAVRKYITDSQSPVRLYNPTAIFADQAAYS